MNILFLLVYFTTLPTIYYVKYLLFSYSTHFFMTSSGCKISLYLYSIRASHFLMPFTFTRFSFEGHIIRAKRISESAEPASSTRLPRYYPAVTYRRTKRATMSNHLGAKKYLAQAVEALQPRPNRALLSLWGKKILLPRPYCKRSSSLF